MNRSGSVIALGMFDGMHIGHRYILDRTVELARLYDLTSTVYTFENHPQELFGHAPKLLMSPARRRELILKAGIAHVIMMRFTKELAMLEPEDFIYTLINEYNMKYVVAGYNHTYGNKGKGNAELLTASGKKHGFGCDIIPPVTFNDNAVSSTSIRTLLVEGNITLANFMLGRNYSYEGTVIKNRRIGSSIGFPTANLKYNPNFQLPKEGVYITKTVCDGKAYESVTNIGNNPTVGNDELSIETHLFDFKGDLYGKRLSVNFYERIRDEIKFESLTDLSQRIKLDVELAKGYFSGTIERQVGKNLKSLKY